MPKGDPYSRSLAIAGTVLVVFPIVAMFLTSLLRRGMVFRVDWLLPAELFPLVVVGAVALLWAAARERRRVALIASGLGTVVAALVASQVVSAVSGLARGVTTPQSARSAWLAVLVLLGVYGAAMLELVVSGILLVADTFTSHGKHEAQPETAATPESE